MRRSSKILSAISGIFVLVSILLGIIFACCFNHSFYSYEYQKNHQAEVIGMSDEDLMKATDTLLDYLEDKRDDIIVEAQVNDDQREVFNERETLHMIDVKGLCIHAKMAAGILFLAGICICIYLFVKEKKNRLEIYSYGFYHGLFCILIFVSLIAIYAFSDFYDFWMNFHYVFFDNDLFILDPNTSIMINMFPESFFSDLVFLIIIIYAIILVLTAIVFQVLKRKKKYA